MAATISFISCSFSMDSLRMHTNLLNQKIKKFTMKNFQIKSAFAAFLLIFTAAFTSCDNDDDDVVDPAAAEIALTAPTDGAIVNAGQSVAITGTITSPKEIHGYMLFVRQKADGKVLFTK